MSRLKKNWLEWVVFGVSLLVLAGVGGLLAWDAVATDGRPPHLVVGQPQITRYDNALEATVQIHNAGDQAVEQVRVELWMRAGAGDERRGSFTIDLLPGGASRSGAVIFLGVRPGEAQAAARVVGYRVP